MYQYNQPNNFPNSYPPDQYYASDSEYDYDEPQQFYIDPEDRPRPEPVTTTIEDAIAFRRRKHPEFYTLNYHNVSFKRALRRFYVNRKFTLIPVNYS